MKWQLSHLRSTAFIRALALAFVALITLPASVMTARAAELAEQAHSLNKVPADAAFYSASLRLKEQWDAFAGSKAYSKLMEIPLIQLGKMQLMFQWQQSNEPTVAKLREYLQSPAGQDAVGVLHEMFADETFCYGGSDLAQTVRFLMELNSASRTARIEAQTEGEDPGKVLTDKMIKKLTEQLEKGLNIPTVVLGFRIKDSERAKRELNEIHSLLRNALDEHQPDLAAHLQREQITGKEFLTMRLDGSMIPWDKIEEDAKDVDEVQLQEIRSAISKKTVVVALGVADEFVLLSVGATADHLEKFGEGEKLSDQAALKPLEKHAGERLVSIGYMSKAFAESLGSVEKTKEDIVGGIEEAMVQAKVDEEDRKLILDDLRELDLSKYVPAPADTTGIAFLTARGYEAYQYSAGKRPMMDGSKPLEILKHVGGNPLVMVAARSKDDVENYKQMVEWLKKVAGHAESIAEKKADADDWAKYQEVRGKGLELLKRLDEANRENLFPALADGQSAMVIDFTATSQKWFEKMPESPKPLPMLEFALITGVSDAEKLKAGIKTYIDVAREGYKTLKEMHEEDVPEIKLPKPVVTELDGGGKLYTYPLPKKWGIDSQVAVNAGITNTFAAVSLMPLTTERLLKEQAPELDTSLKLDGNLALVSHVKFAKLIDAVRPWMDYGLDVATGKIKPKAKQAEDDGDEEKPAPPPSPIMMQLGFVVPQVHQLLDVASTLRSATSVVYEEDGLWVTHSETHIEDLK